MPVFYAALAVYLSGFFLTARHRYHVMRPEFQKNSYGNDGQWVKRWDGITSPGDAYGMAVLTAIPWPVTWLCIFIALAITMKTPPTPAEAAQMEREQKEIAERLRVSKENAVRALEREHLSDL